MIGDSVLSLKRGRRRKWLALLGCVLVAVLLPFSYRISDKLESAVHIKGGEAERVQEELRTSFGSAYVNRVVVVVRGLGNADREPGSKGLQEIVTSLQGDAAVSGVLSSLDSADKMFGGGEGGALVVVGFKPDAGSLEAQIPKLRSRLVELQGQLRPMFPAIRLELTGEIPLNADFRTVSSENVNQAESRALPITLVLLVLAFGSVVAALLPLGVGLLSISMAMGATALLAHSFHFSVLVENLATMLGLGLGIDYALLMVSRFREAMDEGHPPTIAADLAGQQAGKVLMVSAATVAIGFAALLWVPISEIRSIGIGGLLVSMMCLALCILVLPYVLSVLGARINLGRIKLIHAGKKPTDREQRKGNRWYRWGMTVTAHPLIALVLAGLPLALLAGHGFKIATGLPDGNWLPPEVESVQALRTLQGMNRSGVVESLRVIVELPEGKGPVTDEGWKALTRLTRYLQKDARTAEVLSLPTLTDMAESAEDLQVVPETTQINFLRKDGRASLIEVLPAGRLAPDTLLKWVSELRRLDISKITGLAGTKIRIGGIPALNADYDQTVRKRMPGVMAAVVGGSFLALLVGFRSVVAPLKAVMLNLLSVGASFGALVLVFQEGYGSWLFGLSGGVGRIFPIVPVLTFAIVFGMSMDYEVFLVSRVLEERRKGLMEREAVAEGLASTAKLITSAAAIMIVVFAAFTMGSFLVVKMLGFTLAVAVLLDATIVRMIIGPALLQLAGDWNWWPWGLGRKTFV